MASRYEGTEIPPFDTAEEFVAWLSADFERVRDHHGLVILDKDDLAAIVSVCNHLGEIHARTDGLTQSTPNEEEHL